MEGELSSLQKSASDSYSRIQQLELQVASKALGRDSAPAKKASAESSAELTELRRRSAQQALENESLRTQLADARREVVSTRQQGDGGKSGEPCTASCIDVYLTDAYARWWRCRCPQGAVGQAQQREQPIEE
jgi:hypothetical protein